ncbi:MAG: phasin family protein [Pseudomonadota bacterium]
MSKEKETKSLRERTVELEAQTRDVAQKIWLAGLGAYGRAFSEAVEGAQKLTHQTSELFEDLVERGTEIETDMKDRITQNETVQSATESVTKVTDAALKLQREQRERFEARMQRMRSLLGFDQADSDKADEISEKLDRLEDEIAELAAKSTKAGPDKTVATRLARLGAEIDAVAAMNTPKPKRKPAARKTAAKPAAAKAKTAKAKAPAKKAPAKPRAARKTAKA